MAITFIRIDDRIIHGQVLTQWTRVYPCDGIIVVNDELSENKTLGQIYKNAAPSNIKVHIFSLEKTMSKLEEAKNSDKKYYLISKSPIELSEIVKGGGDIGKHIIYGPSSYKADSITIGPNQSLTKEEMDACEVLHNYGIDIEFRLTPGKKGFKWSDARKKYY